MRRGGPQRPEAKDLWLAAHTAFGKGPCEMINPDP